MFGSTWCGGPPRATTLLPIRMELHEAAAAGETDRVRQLLTAGEAVDTIRPADGSTSLLLAALGGHTATVALLLEHNASPAIAKSNGATPVFAAAAADAADCVRLSVSYTHLTLPTKRIV